MFSPVLVSRDFSADRMQPFVPVGVIEVPMRVNQMFDRIVAKTRQRFSYPSPCARNAGIDEEFPVAAGKHGDVSAGSFENVDVAAQLCDSDLRARRSVANGDDRTFGGSEESVRH